MIAGSAASRSLLISLSFFPKAEVLAARGRVNTGRFTPGGSGGTRKSYLTFRSTAGKSCCFKGRVSVYVIECCDITLLFCKKRNFCVLNGFGFLESVRFEFHCRSSTVLGVESKHNIDFPPPVSIEQKMSSPSRTRATSFSCENPSLECFHCGTFLTISVMVRTPWRFLQRYRGAIVGCWSPGR